MGEETADLLFPSCAAAAAAGTMFEFYLLLFVCIASPPLSPSTLLIEIERGASVIGVVFACFVLLGYFFPYSPFIPDHLPLCCGDTLYWRDRHAGHHTSPQQTRSTPHTMYVACNRIGAPLDTHPMHMQMDFDAHVCTHWVDACIEVTDSPTAGGRTAVDGG